MGQIFFPELNTERLCLRRLKEADWETIMFLRSDKEVNEFVKRPSAKSKENALAFIQKINKGIDNRNLYYWAITEKNVGGMIGSICLWNLADNQKSAEVGYDLNPLFQKKGIMSESLKVILEFGFKNLTLDFIIACTHRDNSKSKKLLERNKFKLARFKTDEQNKDNLVYEIKNACS